DRGGARFEALDGCADPHRARLERHPPPGPIDRGDPAFPAAGPAAGLLPDAPRPRLRASPAGTRTGTDRLLERFGLCRKVTEPALGPRQHRVHPGNGEVTALQLPAGRLELVAEVSDDPFRFLARAADLLVALAAGATALVIGGPERVGRA